MSRVRGSTSNPFLPRVSPSGAPFIVRSVCPGMGAGTGLTSVATALASVIQALEENPSAA